MEVHHYDIAVDFLQTRRADYLYLLHVHVIWVRTTEHPSTLHSAQPSSAVVSASLVHHRVGESGANSHKNYKRGFLLHGSCEAKIVYWDMEMDYWR